LQFVEDKDFAAFIGELAKLFGETKSMEKPLIFADKGSGARCLGNWRVFLVIRGLLVFGGVAAGFAMLG